jgi:hypothetical protein
MKKAEDTLRAWTLSTNDPTAHPRSQIHRFFYGRVLTRTFETFYNGGVEISGHRLSYRELCESQIVINGVDYPSLSSIFKEAETILVPDQEWGVEVFGLGDGHGGNVMIGSSTLKNGSREILYIDYEVTGFHSPILDIAKPLYNDVFFNIFYDDILNVTPYMTSSFEHGRIQINIDVKFDSLSRAILEIKRRYLLEPFWWIMRQHGFDLFSLEKYAKTRICSFGLRRAFSRLLW